MEKLTELFGLVNWVFAAILLIAGRYWGGKYFTISKNSALNFLAFATVFGIIYLVILHFVSGIKKEDVVSLFITYLITTSFYEILAKFLLERIEDWFASKKEGKP